MNIERTKQVRLGTILSYIYVVINIVVSVVYTPLMIKFLGTSEYGLYNTVSSTISSLSILSLGFGGAYIKFFSKYKKNDDELSIAKLNGLYIIIFTIIAIIAFLCGVFLTYNLQLIFSTGLTSQEYETARILMWLLTCNLAITFLFNTFTTIITSHEKFIFLKICNILKIILKPVTGIVAMLLGFGSIGLVVSIVFVSFAIDVSNLIYVVFVLRQKFVFKNFESKLFQKLFGFTFFIFLSILIDQINTSVDKIIIGRYQGTSQVAIYSVGLLFYECFSLFSSAISQVFSPKIYNLHENGDKVGTQNLFVKIGRIQFIVLMLICSGFVFFGRFFIGFWVGEEYLNAYWIALLIMIPSTVPLIQKLGLDIQQAQNKHKFRSLIYLAMALINVVLSIFLCKAYGAVGSAIGTAISFVIANGLVMNIYYKKAIGLDIGTFWKNILRVSVGLIIPIVMGVLIMILVPITSIWIMLALICAYVIVYCLSMYVFAMNQDEKRYVSIVLNKLMFWKRKENKNDAVNSGEQ